MIALKETPNFAKTTDSLLPAIIQHAHTERVLMLGYMNEEALNQTLTTAQATFFSRSKNRLWTKGETSKNYLHILEAKLDCDQDTLLFKALPDGPTCHLGNETCFEETNAKGFLHSLEATILQRKATPREGSYTNHLFDAGTQKIAQKVGEEAVEMILEAMSGDRERLVEESADLFYHWLVLLADQGVQLIDIENQLKARHQ